MQPHALPLSGAEWPALVPDRIRDAQPTEVVHESCPAQRRVPRASDCPSRAPRRGRDRRPPASGPSKYGDFRSRSSQSPRSAASNRSPEITTASAGSAAITASQVRIESRSPRIVAAFAHSSADSAGSNCLPDRSRASDLAASNAADTVRDLDVLGELGDPCCRGDLIALRPARPAASVPVLVRRSDRFAHLLGQAEMLGERPRDRRVLRRSCRSTSR